jgi:hypothetical protein
MQIKFLTGFSHACVCIMQQYHVKHSLSLLCVSKVRGLVMVACLHHSLFIAEITVFCLRKLKIRRGLKTPNIYILLYLLHYIGLKAFICVMYLLIQIEKKTKARKPLRGFDHDILRQICQIFRGMKCKKNAAFPCIVFTY